MFVYIGELVVIWVHDIAFFGSLFVIETEPGGHDDVHNVLWPKQPFVHWSTVYRACVSFFGLVSLFIFLKIFCPMSPSHQFVQ